MVLSGYNVISWMDSRLEWDPLDYPGIKQINVHPDLVWKPGIVFYNARDGEFRPKFPTKVMISPNGGVTWMPPSLFRGTCHLRIQLFPFDKQICKLTFRSSDFDASVLDFDRQYALDSSNIEGSNVSAEWVLLNMEYEKGQNSDESERAFNEIHFIYTLQRMPLFYILNMILPIWMMFSLSIFVFYLPTDACEKMTLSISILIGQTVFLTLLAKQTPETSLEIPLLSGYLLFTIIMVSFSVVTSVVVCNVHFRTSKTHDLPPVFQTIFIDHIARYLRIKRPKTFEIDMPNRHGGGCSEDARTTSMCYDLELEEDNGKGVASEILYNTHSKLYGCSDRKRHTGKHNNIRIVTKPLARELRPAVEAIGTVDISFIFIKT